MRGGAQSLLPIHISNLCWTAVAADSAGSESLQLALKAGDSTSAKPTEALLTRAQQQTGSLKSTPQGCSTTHNASPKAPRAVQTPVKSVQSSVKNSVKRKAVDDIVSALGVDEASASHCDKVRKV